jgi:hypothetical protein
MADRILQGMTGVADKIQEGRAEGMSVIGREDVSQADLLRAQFAMNESSTLLTAASKTVQSIKDSIKQLQQG